MFQRVLLQLIALCLDVNNNHKKKHRRGPMLFYLYYTLSILFLNIKPIETT